MVGASLRRRAGLPLGLELDPNRVVIGRAVGPPAIVARCGAKTVYVFPDEAGRVADLKTEDGVIYADGVPVA
jgi:hypothetical protein